MPWVKDATGKQHWESDATSTVKGEGTFDAEAVAADQKAEENRKKLQAAIRKKGDAQDSDSQPKQLPDESLGSYAERLRKWREGNAALVGQKKALSE